MGHLTFLTTASRHLRSVAPERHKREDPRVTLLVARSDCKGEACEREQSQAY